MNILLLFLNLTLVLSCACFWLSLAKLASKPAFLTGVFVVAYADIVLILETAGLLSILNSWAVLTFQLLLTGFSALAWFWGGRPNLLGPFSKVVIADNLIKEIFVKIKEHRLLTILMAGVTIVFLHGAQSILGTHPANPDSLQYHLSRVGYWLQYQSLDVWPTQNFRQIVFPMNGELGILWTVLWWGTDQLSGFVQWMAVPVIAIAIYGLSLLLGYSRQQGLYSAFLWATLPQVIFQSVTTQNDLITASFWVACVYLFFIGLREWSAAAFCLSGIAFGLAIGSKSTSLLVVPGLALALFLIIRKYASMQGFRTHMLTWALSAFLGSLVFGSYVYIQNTVVFGHPLGPRSFSSDVIGTRESDSLFTHLSLLRDNSARYLYQMVDFSPLPSGLNSGIQPIKKGLFSIIYGVLGIRVENQQTIGRTAFNLDYINPLNADNSWFGPLLVFLIPIIIYQTYAGMTKKGPLRVTLGLFPIVFFAFYCAIQAWTPAKGRYFMIPVAVSFPLLGELLNPVLARGKLVRLTIVFLGLISLFTIFARSTGTTTIDWKDVLLLRRDAPAWADEFEYRMVMEIVPESASIGASSAFTFPDYPLFGEHFTRRVNMAIPDGLVIFSGVDYGQFSTDFENSDYMLLPGNKSSLEKNTLLTHFLLMRSDSHSLWIRKDLHLKDECNDTDWPFIRFYEDSSENICAQYPLVVQADVKTPDGEFRPEITPGALGALRFNFLVYQDTEAIFSILLHSRTIYNQTLQVVLTGSKTGASTYTAKFKNGDNVILPIPLKADLYTVEFFLAENSEWAKIWDIQVTTP